MGNGWNRSREKFLKSSKDLHIPIQQQFPADRFLNSYSVKETKITDIRRTPTNSWIYSGSSSPAQFPGKPRISRIWTWTWAWVRNTGESRHNNPKHRDNRNGNIWQTVWESFGSNETQRGDIWLPLFRYKLFLLYIIFFCSAFIEAEANGFFVLFRQMLIQISIPNFLFCFKYIARWFIDKFLSLFVSLSMRNV